MMLVMLTPSLACAMPVCGEKMVAKKATIPCTDHADYSSDQQSDAGQKVKLLKDCMGVDLQVADSISVGQPDIHVYTVALLPSDGPTVTTPDGEADVIRGPPPDWPVAHSTQPSLILSTQRFRI